MNKTLKSIDDGMKKAVSMLGKINENLKDLKHEVAKENQKSFLWLVGFLW